jgi:DNA polymerase IIIc chi subunit
MALRSTRPRVRLDSLSWTSSAEAFLAHYERHAAAPLLDPVDVTTGSSSARRAHAPVSRQRVALWEACELFALMLHSWARVQPVRMTHMLLLLERHGRATGLW